MPLVWQSQLVSAGHTTKTTKVTKENLINLIHPLSDLSGLCGKKSLTKWRFPATWIIAAHFFLCQVAYSQSPLPGLTATELESFNSGKAAFSHRFSIDEGLGPLFNERSCAGCHRAPAPGGDEGLCEHCLVTRATSLGANSLLQRYSIGIERAQFSACREVLPHILAAGERRSTRRPLSLFGVGLIETVLDETIIKLAKSQKNTPGRAHIIKDGDRVRVGRFGWKAQFATLQDFTADSLLEEHGITTPLKASDNLAGIAPSIHQLCDPVNDPEDRGSRLSALVDFQRFLAASKPKLKGSGLALFQKIGCADCHIPTLRTGGDNSTPESLRDKELELFSDLLLHDMGPDGDGIIQGDAGPNEMRTAPLWNLESRFPNGPDNPGSLYHNRRNYPNLIAGILGHASDERNQAYRSVEQFSKLTEQEKGALVSFLIK